MALPIDASASPDGGLRRCAPPPSITTVESAAASYGNSCIHGAWTLEALNGTVSPAPAAGTTTALVAPEALSAGQNTVDPASTFAVHVTGSGQENTSIASSFAQLDASLNTLSATDVGVVDASAYTGVEFDAIIDTGPAGARLTIADLYTDPVGGQCSTAPTTTDKSGCFDHPGVHIAISTVWTHYQVPFASLTQLGFGLPSPVGAEFPKSAIVRLKWDLGIPPSGATPPWSLWVDNLAFY
jgi:hypothetical protein